jgi:hypothetical protein
LDFGAFQMNAFDSNSFQVEALTAVGLVVDIKFQRAQLYHALRFLNQQNLPNSAAGNGVSAVSGDARRFQFTVTTAGTPGANPTMVGGTGAIQPLTISTAATTSGVTLTWNGTPVAAKTYIFNCISE